jgi:hypothetical protein
LLCKSVIFLLSVKDALKNVEEVHDVYNLLWDHSKIIAVYTEGEREREREREGETEREREWKWMCMCVCVIFIARTKYLI